MKSVNVAKYQTIKQINEHAWYRLLKVVFGIFLVIASAPVALVASVILVDIVYSLYDYRFAVFGLCYVITVISMYFGTSRIFYYIVFGKANPKE